MENELRRPENGIYRRALRLAVPMMIQNGITNAVGLVDNLMVGSLGTECMTAVSIAGNLLFVFSLAVFGGLAGPGIYCAQYHGQKNEEGVRQVFRLKIWVALTIVLAGITVFLTAGTPLLRLYLQGEAGEFDAALTLTSAREYLMIMLTGLIPFGITQIYAGTLRETGESVKPMVAGIGSVVTDVLFNWLLIYGRCGFPALGVRGAAIATVIARFAETGIIVIWAHAARGRHPFLRGVYRTLKVPAALAGRIIVKGLPIFLNEFLWAGGMAFMTQCFSLRGMVVIAATNIANALCNLLNVVFIAMGNAVGIIIGQLLGASRFEEAKKDSVRLMWFTCLVNLAITGVLVAFAKVFPGLYPTTEDVRQSATVFIIITALFFPVQGYLNALYFTLRAGGKTVITFLFDSVFTWAVPVPVALVLCRLTGMPVYYVFTLVQACDLIKIVIGMILFRKGVWIANLVDRQGDKSAV
ncbi:MAG: MATE family efflux transporter [Clostridiales bacterium]|nr:MATE family efflux transporter [Clostridiales bacterium]